MYFLFLQEKPRRGGVMLFKPWVLNAFSQTVRTLNNHQ